MTDIIVIGIVLIMLGAAIAYIVKTKKNGTKCIGCPDGCFCSGRNQGDSECNCAVKKIDKYSDKVVK